MTKGVVNAAFEATVPIVVLDAQGNQHPLEAMIDTGFDGELTMPSSDAVAFGLTWKYRQRGFLADGSITFFDVYAATVVWNGAARSVEVEATANTTTLLGTAVLRGHGLVVQFKPGGSVEIDPLP